MGQYLKIMVFADRVEIPSGRSVKIQKKQALPSDERTVCLLYYCYVASSYRRYCEEMLLLSTTRRMVSAKRSATESCFTLAQRSV